MSIDPKERPITLLEVSTFSTALFQALEVHTIGDLCEVTDRRFLAVGNALAEWTPSAPERAPVKSMNEVKNILADMGLHLKPEIPGGSYAALFELVQKEATKTGLPSGLDELHGEPVVYVEWAPGRILIGPDFSKEGVSFSWRIDSSHPEAQSLRTVVPAFYERVQAAADRD